MVHETGLEPVTFALEGRCSSNWATRAQINNQNILNKKT